MKVEGKELKDTSRDTGSFMAACLSGRLLETIKTLSSGAGVETLSEKLCMCVNSDEAYKVV